jgi:hypothetical protein
MAKYERLKKNLNYLFLNVAPDASFGGESWSRVGKSTEWTDTMNVKTTIYEYIEDSGPTEVIENYQPSTSVPLTAYAGDPVYEYIFDLYSRQDIGVNACTRVMRVFQNKTEDNKYKAQISDCTVTIDNFNFTTGVITFNIKQGGTPRLGTAVINESIDTNGNRVWSPEFTAG